MPVVRDLDFVVGADTDLPTLYSAFTRIYGSADLRVLAANDRLEAPASPERVLYIDTDSAAPNTTDVYRVRVNGFATGNDSQLAAARGSSGSGGNCYFLIARPGSSLVVIARLENGVPYGLTTVAHTFSPGEYELGIEVETIDASTVRVRAYLDGTLLGSYDDTSSVRIQTAGRSGTGLEGSASVYATRYRVETFGGTETPQSVAGAIEPSGTLTRQVIRAIAGSATPSGTLSRRGSRTLAGASTPSATLVRRTARALVGAISSAGTVVRRTAKPLAATTTPSGALAKRGTRTLAGAVTPSGTLAAIRAFLTSVAGAVVLSGTAAARVTRALAAAVAPSGTVTKRTATTLAGGVGPTGALQKRHPQVLVGSIAPGGLVWRRQSKPVAGTLAPSAALATQLTVSADLLQLTFVTALGPALTIRYSSLTTVLTMTSFAPEQIPLGTDVVLQLRGVKVFNVGTGTRVPATGITITARIALTPTGDAIDGTLQVTLTERVAGEFHGTLQGSASAAHLRAYLGTLVYVVLRVGTDDYLGHFPVRVVDGVALGV